MSDARFNDDSFPAPFARYEGTVRPDWVDYNGHMNLAYYVVLFDGAVDLMFAALNYGAGHRVAANQGPFAVETHTLYQQELLAGEHVAIASQILAADAKRLHIAHQMYRLPDRARAACQEVMYVNVDLGERRSAPFPPDLHDRLARASEAHRALPRPAWVGRRLRMPEPR